MTTYGHLSQNTPTSSRAVSHVKTLAVVEQRLELSELKADCGLSITALSTRYDPESSSLKTSQTSLFGDWQESCQTLPESGLLLGGECFAVRSSDFHLCDDDCSWLPAPTATANQCAPSMQKWPGCLRLQEIVGSGRSESWPEILEQLMGFPVGYSDVGESETRSYPRWRNGSQDV